MAVQEILGRYNTDSGYDYFYMHTPFEVITPAAAVTNTNGVYNIPTKVPTAHYSRPMLVIFQAPSNSLEGQRISINKGTAILLKPSYRDQLYVGDIVTNATVVVYVDLVKNVAQVISVGGAPPHTSYFRNNFAIGDTWPNNSQHGDLLWNPIYTWAASTQPYSEISIYSRTKQTGVVHYPVTPRQVYYATATSKSGAAYSVTLGEFPLTRRHAQNKYGVMFIARFANPSTGNDTITVDGTNYGRIQIGTSAVNRGLFANEIKANQTCTFQINQDGKIYLLFIDGRAATGAGSTITLSNPSSPPLNPLAGDEWLQIVKVVSP